MGYKRLTLTRGKHLHDHKRRGLGHPLFFIEVTVPSHQSERSRICVLVVSMLPLSTILIFDLRIVSTVWYFRIVSTVWYLILELSPQCDMWYLILGLSPQCDILEFSFRIIVLHYILSYSAVNIIIVYVFSLMHWIIVYCMYISISSIAFE